MTVTIDYEAAAKKPRFPRQVFHCPLCKMPPRISLDSYPPQCGEHRVRCVDVTEDLIRMDERGSIIGLLRRMDEENDGAEFRMWQVIKRIERGRDG